MVSSCNWLQFLSFVRPVGGTQEVKWRSLNDVNALNPNAIRTGQTFKTKVTIIELKREGVVYKACPICSKKVSDNENGTFTCLKCGDDKTEFKWKLALQVCL